VSLVRAAGGIVWRGDGDRARVAVVHRPRRRDWSLPKGKLDRGEAWETAALREVEEETGARASLGAFAGATRHDVKGGPKVVLWWHMDEVGAGERLAGDDEVDEVAWLAPREALERLDHQNERVLLAAAAAARLGALAPGDAAALARARGALLTALEALDRDARGEATLLAAVDALASAVASIPPPNLDALVADDGV
jgi:8-oxo-dGTP pyrophosphatase MutT (NUDIX family)